MFGFDGCALGVQASEWSGYGVPYRHSRDEDLLTPPGPEGSNGSSDFGRRDAAGAERHLTRTAVQAHTSGNTLETLSETVR